MFTTPYVSHVMCHDHVSGAIFLCQKKILKKCYHLSVPILELRNSTRALQSILFLNPGGSLSVTYTGGGVVAWQDSFFLNLDLWEYVYLRSPPPQPSSLPLVHVESLVGLVLLPGQALQGLLEPHQDVGSHLNKTLYERASAHQIGVMLAAFLSGSHLLIWKQYFTEMLMLLKGCFCDAIGLSSQLHT